MGEKYFVLLMGKNKCVIDEEKKNCVIAGKKCVVDRKKTYFVSPKGIYRRNIGDYLRQPYLWVKYMWSSSATLPLVDYVWIYDHILL